MENTIVIFWFVAITALAGLVGAIRRIRLAGPGWMVVYLAILLVDGAAWFFQKNLFMYAALGMWLLLVLLPGILGQKYRRSMVEMDYERALQLARMIGWLHPIKDWRKQPELLRGLVLAKRGEIARASEIFSRLSEVKSLVGLSALINFYRLTGKWEEFRDWARNQAEALEQYPQFLPMLLRALGETGDLPGLVEVYDRKRIEIGAMPAADLRDQCRMILFAFTGKRQALENLFQAQLSILPSPVQKFWLATADMASGEMESSRKQLEALLLEADATTRLAIEQRLQRDLILANTLPASALEFVESVALEQSQDETFARRYPLFSRHAAVTLVLIALNLLMFAMEIHRGGSTDMEALYSLGAVYAPAVWKGEWWRLGASLFLHYGPLHLMMNMLALAWLGPFVENAVGHRRFLLVYFAAGIGGMGSVIALAAGPNVERMVVGASGCIMGLVGATGALMLWGWLREGALAAKRRLYAIVIVVAMQSVFDLMIPQVSMTAHLSGALLGFMITLVLRSRLNAAPALQGSQSKLET